MLQIIHSELIVPR